MRAAVVEVNAETDFVARNEVFQEAVRDIAKAALSAGSVEELSAAKMDSGESVDERLTNLIAKIGENMTLRRREGLTVGSGVVSGYVHNAAGDNLGKIGVLVALEGDADRAEMADLGRKLAMHVAAAAPLSADVDSLDPAVIAKEREVFAEQARASGKPENIIEKMVEGRLRKFYEESVLLKQPFVMDPDKSVEAVLKDAFGDAVRLTGFARLVLGEGVEKKEDDFAGEVAAMAGQDKS
jgi:elongation factor Ts